MPNIILLLMDIFRASSIKSIIDPIAPVIQGHFMVFDWGGDIGLGGILLPVKACKNALDCGVIGLGNDGVEVVVVGGIIGLGKGGW